MQPLDYQSANKEGRKQVVQKIATKLNSMDEKKFPKIAMSVKSGNNKKNQVLELLIVQAYANDMDMEKSFLAVEDNI